MRLKLHEWASIAEILSSLAVVVTLIVLIAEVGGNTAATLAANRQSLASRAENFLLQQAADADLAELVEKAERGAQLTSTESFRYAGFVGARFRNAEEAFLQLHNGQLDEQYFLTRGAVVWDSLNNRHALEFWEDWSARGLFVPGFTAWVNEGLRHQADQ